MAADEPTRGNNHADDDEEEVAHYTELDLELGDEDVAEFDRLQKSRREIISFDDLSAGEYDDDTPFFAHQMAVCQDIDDDYIDYVDYDLQVII